MSAKKDIMFYHNILDVFGRHEMKLTNSIALRTVYETPSVDIINLSSEDIITASGPNDYNQGAWDPQVYSGYPNY